MSCEANIRTLLMDYLTGTQKPDTDDERVRQDVEQLLVDIKGFRADEIEVDHGFELNTADGTEKARLDLVVYVEGKPFMNVKCSKHSIVSRERESLAASRLAFDLQVPLTVVTNGSDADILDTYTGRTTGRGLPAIPSRQEAISAATGLVHEGINTRKREMETRIFLAYSGIRCPMQGS